MIDAAERVLRAYELSPTRVSPLAGGLINATFLVETAAARYVLQRLHPIFAGTVNEDIDVVTRHLQTKGMTTPLLVRTRDGKLWLDSTHVDSITRSDATVRGDAALPRRSGSTQREVGTKDEGVWRLQTFVEGTSVQRVESPARAHAAGALVGRFHEALADLRHDFVFRRAGVHDTARHFALLDEAITQHPDDDVAKLRDELVRLRATIEPIAVAPRIAHGDLKISNLLFNERGDGVCLVDLDTLGEMPLPFELGDAWRSWCNPLGEDDPHARFELPLLQAAWQGYVPHMATSLRPDERALFVSGIATIALELSARFARDVLEDKYFGWDAARFPSRAAHNLVRAQSQLAVARSLLDQRAAAEAIISSS